ncbi:olfactory receptor 10C1-like [Gopherus evgoodei]|uniref:olfactory receptor 10C1-like n=1 Tax=Gopherus evgoodei TaxID=1825980 RepID=UPI0011CFB1BA|nr:olfactory receptor 10C1-like [Gopherus evgoodei]
MVIGGYIQFNPLSYSLTLQQIRGLSLGLEALTNITAEGLRRTSNALTILANYAEQNRLLIQTILQKDFSVVLEDLDPRFKGQCCLRLQPGWNNVSAVADQLSSLAIQIRKERKHNILIIIAISVDPALHTLMCFFLGNLSFLEMCCTSVTLPKMLANLLSEDKTISFAGCAVQMYFFLFFGGTECFLLAAMAYDRYCAVCNPRRYTAIMNKRVYMQLSGGSYICGMLVALKHTIFIFTLPFCGPNVINHFLCEIQPLLKLVCRDTYWNEIQIIVGAAIILILPLLLILVSYTFVISTILKISSAEGRCKIFSTCSSHLIVVTLFCGMALIMYVRLKSSFSPDVNKLLSLFYSVVTPTLNPIIYSLRNKEVKDALRKTGMKIFS